MSERTTQPGERIGTRELRADLATQVRRAASGHRIVVTSGGRPVATLGPIEATPGVTAGIDALVAAGLLVPPRRHGPATASAPVPIWSGIRLDRALREVRG